MAMLRRRFLVLSFSLLLLGMGGTNAATGGTTSSTTKKDMYTLDELEELKAVELTSKDFGSTVSDGNIWL